MTEEIRLLKNKLDREIQARRQAEKLLEDKSEELYDTLNEVKKSEALLQSALSNMDEGFLLTDANSKILLFNQQLKQIYAKYFDQIKCGSNLNDFFDVYIAHPAYQNMLEQELSQCSFEIKLNKNQTIAVYINRKEKNIIVSTHKDVSQKKRLITDQQQTLLKLLQAEKMEHIGKMASTVAHDFNNIIAAIKGYASFLKEDMPNEPNLHDSVDKIQQASERAQEMVQNILAFSKHSQPKLEKLCVNNLLQETIDLMKPNIPSSVSLTFEEHNEDSYIKGNATQLAQTFINLINNSINAFGIQKGAISIQIILLDQIDLNLPNICSQKHMPADCEVTQTGLAIINEKCVKLNFIDDGPGMNKEIMSHIFDLFFTTKNSNKGTGLGMHSVATTIKNHNGGIKVHSKPHLGTMIEIVFPKLELDILGQIQTEKSRDQLESNSENLPQVLIIDDNQEVGRFIQQTLLRENIESKYIDSPESGIVEIFRDPSRWQLIICDQKMPNILGLEILKTIRTEAISIPFILTSGFLDELKNNQDIALADQLIPKPIDIKLLMECVYKFTDL